jgi:hypothetical protein
MLDRSLDQPLPHEPSRREHPPFAASHRAPGACARERARLIDAVTSGVASLHASRGTEKPVQRQTPSRCIVQLGPVALTIAWLQHSTDTVADGELLVAVWSGPVASSAHYHPERVNASPLARKATVLWEEVLTVDAPDEESWQWQLARPDGASFTSTALADRCVERLQLAYDESQTDCGVRRATS